MLKGIWFPPVVYFPLLKFKNMSTIKVLSINEEKEIAFLSVHGETSKLGIIPEKVGLVRYDPKVFKAAKGDVIVDESVIYKSVETRSSATDDGVIFNWLLF